MRRAALLLAVLAAACGEPAPPAERRYAAPQGLESGLVEVREVDTVVRMRSEDESAFESVQHQQIGFLVKFAQQHVLALAGFGLAADFVVMPSGHTPERPASTNSSRICRTGWHTRWPSATTARRRRVSW